MKNSQGLWKLSPSGLYRFSECPSCFWVDNHYRKAPMLPLLLNSAMDSILKSRYDQYRGNDEFPPEAVELADEGIKPFDNLGLLNEWRSKSSALKVTNEDVGYELIGKIDDVLVESDGRLIPADYKSSGNAPAEDKQKYYRDQLAAYGFMFRHHGHKVSDRAYLLHYYVKDKNDPSLAVVFDAHVDKVDIGAIDIEQKLANMVALLNKPYPGHNPECDTCAYHDGRNGKIHE